MSSDYLVRQIEDIVRSLASVLFENKPVDQHEVFDVEGNFSDENFLFYVLKKKALSGEILEAEQMLFEALEKDHSAGYLKIALAFYHELEELNDARLASSRYSRQAILDGLQRLNTLYFTNH